MAKIKSVTAEKILDSRGNWTEKAVVELQDGSKGYGEVPSGASVGGKEAVLLPVDQAIGNVNDIIAKKIVGLDAGSQEEIDQTMVKLDGTNNKSKLGANATLAVSLAVCEAEATSRKVPLYRYIAETYGFSLDATLFPTPLFNILNGGAHAVNDLQFQEFMIAPGTGKQFPEALKIGVEIYHSLKKKLELNDLATSVGDEGGFAPKSLDTRKALTYLVESGLEAGYQAGKDYFIAIDAAANSFCKNGIYALREISDNHDSSDLLDFYINLCRNFPIIYLEDPFAENDFNAWYSLNESLGDKVEIIGDDLVATSPTFLSKALIEKAVTGVIVKPNQIGTLTETISFVKKAKENELVVVVSHRSGETAEDTFIADLSVAIGARYIKAGAPARGERVVKYNRLLDIYGELH